MIFCFPLCQADSLLMPYNFETFNSVAEVPFEQWQRMVPANNLMFQFSYLKHLEENQQGNMRFKYVLVRQNEALMGVAYFQVVQFSGTQLSNYHAESSIVNRIKDWVLPLIKVEMLVGANLLMTGEKGFYCKTGISETDMADMYLQVVQHIFKSETQIGAFLMTDIFETDSVLRQKFEAEGFHPIYEEPDMKMQLRPEWKSIDDYLNSISSKYRVRAKKCMALSGSLVRKNLSEQEVKNFEPDIYRLYKNTIAKSTFNLFELQPGFFTGQKQLFGERYMVFGYFLNDKLVGFNSLYCNQKSGEVHYIGLDYEVNKKHHTYQRMLYDMVECGIEQQFARLHFGRTASEIKSTVGAVPVTVNGILKHRNFIVNNIIIKPLAAAIKPKDFVFRNPFKDTVA